MINHIEPINGIPNYAFQYTNYRLKTKNEYNQDIWNARYEGMMRSDFSSPNINKYTYDKVEVVRLT